MPLNVNALNMAFRKTTNSYKYLFFLSILELLKNSSFKNPVLSYREITSMMISYAWGPCYYFKLSLGKQDQIYKVIDELNISHKNTTLNNRFKTIYLNDSIEKNNLLKYVPQRFIREFFVEELKNIHENNIDKSIQSVSQITINESFTFYKIDKKSKTIEFPPEWLNFIRTNYLILHGWGENEWGKYLQKKNPNTPAIFNKLGLDISRTNLSKERNYWKSAIYKDDFKCIYTNEKINDNFHLDHFLPWRFIAHNQFWNLIPTSPNINSLKLDSLPNIKYLSRLAENHFKVLNLLKNNLSQNEFDNIFTSYMDGLGITNEFDFLSNLDFEDAYTRTLSPLLQIGKNVGFKSDWMYS
jgi:hypothetical protein